MRRVSQSTTSSRTRQEVPAETLAVQPVRHPGQAPGHTAERCVSLHGLRDPTTAGLTALLLHFISFLLCVALDIRIAGKQTEPQIADCFKISLVQEISQITIMLKGDC